MGKSQRLSKIQIFVCRAKKVKCNCRSTYLFNSVMLSGNFKKDDLLKYGISVFLTMEIFQIWPEEYFNPDVISVDHYLSIGLWHTFLIKINNRTAIFHTSWQSKDVKNVPHQMKDSTTVISNHEFDERFGINFFFCLWISYICIKISKTIK